MFCSPFDICYQAGIYLNVVGREDGIIVILRVFRICTGVTTEMNVRNA